jgi:hypothetical protein
VVGCNRSVGDRKIHRAPCQGSTAGDPLPCSVAGALTNSATVNGLAPFGGPANRPIST